MLLVHPEDRERLAGYVGKVYTPGFYNRPDMLALQQTHLFTINCLFLFYDDKIYLILELGFQSSSDAVFGDLFESVASDPVVLPETVVRGVGRTHHVREPRAPRFGWKILEKFKFFVPITTFEIF